MKKLMIAAAAAAMIGGAEAQLAQVYDFTATLKTTQCKEAKVSAALAKYFDTGSYDGLEVYEKGDKVGLRKQDSRKILGVIWGCNCPTIQNPGWRVYNGKTLGGYMFWDQDLDDYFRVKFTGFRWNVLNRIDAMTKCEGAFTLWNSANGQAIRLDGAGFGTVKDNACETYIPSISGNCVGYRQPNDGDFASCVFCQAGNGCLVDPLCDVCFGVGAYDVNKTIAYGTWKIKFNSGISNKLAKDGCISRVYKFKKAGAAKDVLAFLEKYVPANSIALDGSDEIEPPAYIDEAEDLFDDEEVEDIDSADVIDTAAGNFDGDEDELPSYIQVENDAEEADGDWS